MYRDSQAPIPARVKDLLARMTLAEKIGQMTQVENRSIAPPEVTRCSIGSVLSGGGGNPGAIGARVELTAAGVTQRRQVMPARSYLSQVELPVTFGLGRNETVDAVRILWPDGSGQDVRVDGVDRLIEVARD